MYDLLFGLKNPIYNINWFVLQEMGKLGRGILRGITLEIFSFNQYEGINRYI